MMIKECGLLVSIFLISNSISSQDFPVVDLLRKHKLDQVDHEIGQLSPLAKSMIQWQINFLKQHEGFNSQFDTLMQFRQGEDPLGEFYFYINKGDYLFYKLNDKNIEARNSYVKALELSRNQKNTQLICEAIKKLLLMNELSYLLDNSMAFFYINLYADYAYDEYEVCQFKYYKLLFLYQNDLINGKWDDALADEILLYTQSSKHFLLNVRVYNLLANYSYNVENDSQRALTFDSLSIQYLDSIKYNFKSTVLKQTYIGIVRHLVFEGRIKEAKVYLNEMDTSNRNKMELDYSRFYFFYKSIIDTSFNDYKSGYSNFRKYAFISERASYYSNLTSLRLLETQYQTKQKEAEIKQGALRTKNLTITLLAALVIGGISIIFYSQRSRMTKIVARKNDQIHNQEVNRLLKDQELKSLDAMLEGQEIERKRMAEDLHDRLGSTLSAAKLHFEAALANGNQESQATVLLDKAIQDTREIAHDVLSGVLSKFGLLAALQDLKETVEGANGIRMDITTKQFDCRLEPDQEINLYRIVQESVSNALKHAKASELSISLTKENEHLELVVTDNGAGFDQEINTEGVGLKNIAARVAKINAQLTINSTPGKGTNLNINIPV